MFLNNIRVVMEKNIKEEIVTSLKGGICMANAIYLFLHKNLTKFILFVCAYLSNIVLSFISANTHSLNDITNRLGSLSDLSILFAYLLIALLILYSIAHFVLWRYVSRTSIEARMYKYMSQYTNEVFDDLEKCTCYSWGEDRTFIICKDIFKGWSSEDIIIEKLDCDIYNIERSTQVGEKWKECLADVNSTLYKLLTGVGSFGSDNDKWMLTNIRPTYSRERPNQVYIQLKKTKWSQTSFIWHDFMNNLETRKKEITLLVKDDKAMLPNSFCLHLVLVSKDDKVISTKISNYKRNDYPNKWATTLGEQIEYEDFSDGRSIQTDFLTRWTKRAMCEEFGIGSADFECIVDKNSIKGLAINIEGDIYNFSLVCCVSMLVSYDDFRKKISTTCAKDIEFSDIDSINIDDIPIILLDNSESDKYHPSSFIRLLLTYLHKRGLYGFTVTVDKLGKKYK